MNRPTSPDKVQQDLRARINAGTLDAYLWIPQDLSQSFELHMRNPDNFALVTPTLECGRSVPDRRAAE